MGSDQQTTEDVHPPFHLVSAVSGKHIGPFSTYTDALLARHIANPEFEAALVMDKDAFDIHLGTGL